VSVGYGKWLPDAGAAVVTLDPAAFREVIAVAVGGPTFRIRRNEDRIVRTLTRAVQPWRRPGPQS
jgi:hypothetical protein